MAGRSINKVMLLGNLTRDPVVKYTSGGTAVATFGLATNRTWNTADGQTKEDVQYHNIVAWAKLADLVNKLLTKGRKVYVEGRLTTRKFTGKDGLERTVTEIVMDDFIVFGDGKRGQDQHPSPGNAPNDAGADQGPPEPTHAETVPTNESINPDDIPF